MVSIQPHSQALQIHVLAAYFTIELSKDIGQVCSQGSRVGNGLGTSLVCLKVDHDQLHHNYSISIVATLAHCLQLQS